MVGQRPKTLYLRRYLLNGDELFEWARANRIGGVPVRPSALHVTVLYSRRPLDWSRVDPDARDLVVEPGRRRRIERLSSNDIVLSFDAPHLEDRHRSLLRLGASGGLQYRPHITLAHGPEFRPPEGPPFAGRLHFGPERASPVPARGSEA